MPTLSEIAISLLEQSVATDVIAYALHVDEDVIVELRDTHNITVKVDDITEAMNKLGWQAYRKAQELLEIGTPNQQMMVIRMMFGQMRGLAGIGSPKVLADLVARFKSTIEMHGDELADEEMEELPEDSPV